MAGLHAAVSSLLEHWHALLTWLSALTLGEIWAKCYNPPTPRSLALAVIILLPKFPEWYSRYSAWRVSRRVVEFRWPLPKVSATERLSVEFG